MKRLAAVLSAALQLTSVALLTAAASSPAFAAGVVPTIEISGGLRAFKGMQLWPTLYANFGANTPVDVAWSWTIANASTKAVLQSGDTGYVPSFTPDAVGNLVLTVSAKAAGTTTVVRKSQILYVTNPLKPLVAISGPKRVGVGHTGTFCATAKAPFPSSNPQSYTPGLYVTGQFVLPDGTTKAADTYVNGLPCVEYSPPAPASNLSPSVALGSLVKVGYQAYFAGYQDAAVATAYASTQSWFYRFPANWSVGATVTGTSAPALVRAVAKAGEPALVPFLDGLTYEWTLPSAFSANSVAGSVVSGRLLDGGSFPVSVRISDKFGNSATAETSFVVGAPPSLVASVAVANQSKWTHAPLKIGVVGRVTGGDGLFDPVTSYAFSVDGQTAVTQKSNSTSLNLVVGTHRVGFVATTGRGAVAEKFVDVTVPEPDVPTCSLVAVGPSSTGVVGLTLTGNSTTGSIVKYMWTNSLQTAPLAVTSNKLAFKLNTSTAVTYTGYAVTDAGLQCSASYPQ